MQTRWIIAIVAAAVAGCVGVGVSVGWYLWGVPLGAAVEHNAELERAAQRLEADLGAAQDEIAHAREVNRELAERQRRTEEVIDRAADRLAEAAGNASSITELIDRSIAIVDELFVALGGSDQGVFGESVTSGEIRPP